MISAPLLAAAGFGAFLVADRKDHTGRLQRMARAYVKRKYGFKARASRVQTMAIGWLEPTWHKGKSGYVEMTYGKTSFHVRADLRSGTDSCSDTYQMREFTERILGPIRDGLACDKLCATVRYGDRDFGGSYLGLGVKSFEDLVRDIDNVEVVVSTHGLDHSRIDRLDLSYLGQKPRVGIYDWEDASVVEAGYTPFGEVQASDGDTICLLDHFLFLDGTWTRRSYRRFHGEGVTFAYRADLGVEVAPIDVDVPEDEAIVARSPWYELSASCEEETRVIVFPHETSPGIEMHIQLYDPAARKLLDGFGGLPYYGNFEKQDPLPDKWPYHGAVWLNLTYKDGTVDRAPKVARIVRD